jgi:hypothetical protein
MDNHNPAVVTVRAGIAKRVGRPNFSSYEANLQLEMTLDLGAVTDDKFPEFLAELYGKIQTEVDAQIATEIYRQDNTKNDLPMAKTVAPAVVTPYMPTQKFGDFLREKSSELSVEPEALVRHWYKSHVGGPLTLFPEQGKMLNELWNAGVIKTEDLTRSVEKCPAY